MAKEKLILIGGGGHCRSCIDVIESQGQFEIVGIVDKKEKIGQKVGRYSIIADDAGLKDLSAKYKNYLITIGQVKDPQRRIVIYERLKQLKVKLPVVVAATAYVSSTAKIGEGTIIMHHAVVNAYAGVGKNCILNTSCVLEHDVVVKDHCHVSTAAIINGEAFIDHSSFIGSNSVVNEGCKIAANTVIGSGSVVVRSITHKGVYVGNPSRKINI